MGDASSLEADAGMRDASVPDAGQSDAGMACGNGDLVIAASELPNETTLVAFPVLAAEDAALDLHGVERADGSRLWDLEGPYAGDAETTLLRRPIDGQWFAASFPDASYTLPLTNDQSLLGILRRTSTGVSLLGIVSATSGATRTELTYDPPAEVWRFPLVQGERFSTTSSVTGLATGVVSAYSERWDVVVDAHGTIATPAGSFSVLRVRTGLTRTGGSLLVTSRFAFVAECAGIVAQVYAQDGDASEEPTDAARLWRLAP